MTSPAARAADAVTAVQTAISLFTYELAVVPDDYPLRTIGRRADALRAAADELLEVIAAAPDTPLTDVGHGSSGDGDEPNELERLLSRDEVMVAIRVDHPPGVSALVQHLARHLAGRVLPGVRHEQVPVADLVEVDLGRALVDAVAAARGPDPST